MTFSASEGERGRGGEGATWEEFVARMTQRSALQQEQLRSLGDDGRAGQRPLDPTVLSLAHKHEGRELEQNEVYKCHKGD